jgi:hypothetical protein
MIKRGVSFFLAGFAAALALSGCGTIQASVAKSNVADVADMGGKVLIGDLQYDYHQFPIKDKEYYLPKEKGKHLALLTLKPQSIQRRHEYDFTGIVLENSQRQAHPSLLRYFYYFNESDTAEGYAVAKDGVLAATLPKTGKYRIVLAYVCDEKETFDRIIFPDGQAIDFEPELVKAMPIFE